MPATTIKEKKEERAQVVTEARSIIDLAEKEKRDLSDAEREKSDTLINRANTLTSEIDVTEKDQSRGDALNRLEERMNQGATPPPDLPQPGNDGARNDGRPFEFRHGGRVISFQPGSAAHNRSLDEYNKAFRSYLLQGSHQITPEERSSLQAADDTTGGYLVGTQFVANLIKTVDDMLFIRKHANVLPLSSGDSIGFPSLDADPDDFEWTSEIATVKEDTAMRFGKRELKPNPLAKLIKVSNKLLRTSAINVEDLIIQRLSYKQSVTEEKAFLTGSGNEQPLGVFTPSNAGIPTSRDISTGNTATALTADGLIESKYALKPQYWSKARWLFHRDAVKQIALLKDSNGQYLWQPSIKDGQADRILGFAMDVSEFVPNTFTASKYVGLLADWSQYWIVDSLQMTIQRLIELYAENNQVGFIARKETDAMPVLSEGFVRVKLAAS